MALLLMGTPARPSVSTRSPPRWITASRRRALSQSNRLTAVTYLSNGLMHQEEGLHAQMVEDSMHQYAQTRECDCGFHD